MSVDCRRYRAHAAEYFRARDNDERLRPLSRRAAKAVLNASTSWPSTSATRQPKARHFSASGSSVVTDVTGPSTCELLASMTATSRSSRRWAANMAASHTWPSSISPSLRNANTSRSSPASCAASAKPDRAGKSLPKRAADKIAERRPFAAYGLQRRTVAAVGGEILRVDQPGFGGSSVKADDIMAGRQHETVVPVAHRAAEQHGENLGRRERLAEIAKALDRDHPGRAKTNQRGETTQPGSVQVGLAAHPDDPLEMLPDRQRHVRHRRPPA